jgi:hypothetical protein
MSNPQEAPAFNAVADSSIKARDEGLTPAFQYGRIDTISLAPLQRWRAPDSGNGN